MLTNIYLVIEEVAAFKSKTFRLGFIQESAYYFIQYSFLIFLVCVSLGMAGVIFKGDLGAQPVLWS